MKASQSYSLVFLSLLSSLTSAWPVIKSPLDMIKREPQSYSVVAVDGGSTTTASPSPATKTVTDAVTQIQTSVILSTIVATHSNSNSPPATSVVPQTVTFATTVVQTQTQIQSGPPQATVTVSPSSTPYDNGQWHTTYYFKSTAAPAADANDALITSVGSSPQPTTSIDPGQWAAWSGQNNGQYNGQ